MLTHTKPLEYHWHGFNKERDKNNILEYAFYNFNILYRLQLSSSVYVRLHNNMYICKTCIKTDTSLLYLYGSEYRHMNLNMMYKSFTNIFFHKIKNKNENHTEMESE